MAKAFQFICGDDDFLVMREAKDAYARMTEGVDDEFSMEVIEGGAQNGDEVANAVNQFRSAVQTLSLFGTRKVVWLKAMNFLADSVTGRSEGTKEQLGRLQDLLLQVDPEAVGVLISACPVDRRRKETKWFLDNGDSLDIKGGQDESSLMTLARDEAERLGVKFERPAAQMLVAKVNGNTRLVMGETRKLCAYIGTSGESIDEKLVTLLVPNFGEGDFFEASEAFFSLDLKWTLDALRRHFFTNSEARPIISSLQNRNRLLIQLQVLMSSGELSLSPRGFDKASFEAAAKKYAQHFGDMSTKSDFNVFTQNLWYLGNKLAPTARKLSLRKLVDFQVAFTEAFEGILDRPKDQHAVMRDLAVHCLSDR